MMVFSTTIKRQWSRLVAVTVAVALVMFLAVMMAPATRAMDAQPRSRPSTASNVPRFGPMADETDGKGMDDSGWTVVGRERHRPSTMDSRPFPEPGSRGLSLSGPGGDGNPINPPLLIDLSLDKQVSNMAPEVGSAIVFTMTVTNAGPDDATGVAISETLPSGYTLQSHDGGSAWDGSLWDIGDLPSGASAALHITATVNASGVYTNVAQVAAANEQDADSTPGNNDPTEDDQDSVQPTPIPVIDLELAKTVDNPAPNVGDNVTFTITVTNQGPSDATGVTVTDSLPNGYTYVSDDSGGSYDSGTGAWTIGALGAGETVILHITARVEASGNYENWAEVTAADQMDADSDPASDHTADDLNDGLADDDEDSAVVTPNPPGAIGDLVWWDKDQDGLQDAGELGIPGVVLTLTDSITLTAVTDANGLYTFTSLLSDAYTITVDAANFQPGGPLYHWLASPPNQGDDALDSDGDETAHQASVTLAYGQNNTTIDFGFYIPSSYTLTKTLNTPGIIRVGDPISFTIAITNTGASWIAQLSLSDTYDTTFLRYGGFSHFADPPSNDTIDDGQIDWTDLTAQLGDLAPGDAFSVTLWFTALADTTAEPNGLTLNTATASNVLADPDGPSGPLPPDLPLDDQQGPTSDDDPVEILQPTGLFVTHFTAQVEENTVRLAWSTASELHIAGFQVWRRRIPRGDLIPVSDVIPAQFPGMDQGGLYALTDAQLPTGRYAYILQVLTLDGRTLNAEAIQVAMPHYIMPHGTLPSRQPYKTTVH